MSPRRPPHHRLPSSAVSALIRPEAVDALLAPFVPDPADRAFIVRCMLDEGPIHHRGASYALLRLLGLVLAAPGTGAAPAPTEDGAPVPLRLPPHLHAEADEQHYPLRLPLGALDRLAPRGSAEQAALLDCLLDGPPHHALANAAMVCLLEAILRRAEAGTGA